MAGKCVCECGSARCGRGCSYCSDCINVVSYETMREYRCWVVAHQGGKSAVSGPAVSTGTRLFPPTSASVCQSGSAGFLPFRPQPPPSHLHRLLPQLTCRPSPSLLHGRERGTGWHSPSCLGAPGRGHCFMPQSISIVSANNNQYDINTLCRNLLLRNHGKYLNIYKMCFILIMKTSIVHTF